MERTAEISICGRYRYALTRKWSDDPCVLFVMLNPSTADDKDDDPTISRCIGFAKSWGFGSLVVANLFALRSPSPSDLYAAGDPIGRENDRWLEELSRSTDLTIAAWGNHGRHLQRGGAVASRLKEPHVLKLNRTGEPRHPLYVKGDAQPTRWSFGE